MTYVIATEYSKHPSARYEDEGTFGGEQLRIIIAPLLRAAIQNKEKFQLVLDGTSGYGTSFLEEVFGGLIRGEHIAYDDIKSYLVIISAEEPELIDEINQYLDDAHAKES